MTPTRASVVVGIVVGLGMALGAVAPAVAAAPPSEFGSDWDDPRTAAPPVQRPTGPSCTTTIVDTQFRDFTPYRGSYTPPAQCAGPWRTVVLRLDGAVAGRQFDRLGYVKIGGVTVLKTSTPEPSPEGIRWSVEKDVTPYAALLSGPQDVEALIENVVDDTYTGVLDVQVSLTFYPGRPTPGPSTVLPLANPHRDGTTMLGEITVPGNTERLVAEVYATGSGGGCEEFWYLTTPAGAPYSCPADSGPYREVQIRLDGRLAGVAAPYPHIYTGGWSNPFLWYVLPAPRAFDIQPVRYDLTPFAGLLTDGRSHTVEVSVLGVPAGQTGWDVPTNVLAWQDRGSAQVTGAVVRSREGPLTNTATYTKDTDNRVVTRGGHRLTTTGYVDTSHGRVWTTVDRTVRNTSTHHWTDGENTDGLTATWTDEERVEVAGGGAPRWTDTRRRYALDGVLTVDEANRITTTITATDAGQSLGSRAGWTRFDDTYRGQASWTYGVPRADRHPVGTSQERYRTVGPAACYDHRIATQNGYVIADTLRC